MSAVRRFVRLSRIARTITLRQYNTFPSSMDGIRRFKKKARHLLRNDLFRIYEIGQNSFLSDVVKQFSF